MQFRKLTVNLPLNFMKECMIYIMVQLFGMLSSGLDKAIERVALEITRKQDEIAGCNQAIQDCNNRIAQLNAEIARIERAEQEAREAAAREAAAVRRQQEQRRKYIKQEITRSI